MCQPISPLLGEELWRSCRKSITQALSYHGCADMGRKSWAASGCQRATHEPPAEGRRWGDLGRCLTPLPAPMARADLAGAAEDMLRHPPCPSTRSRESQCAADRVCPSPGLHGGRAGGPGWQQGAWGSLACAPAPLQAGDALGQGLAPHCHRSRSKPKRGSSQQESSPLRPLSSAGKGNCGQKGLPKVLLFLF